MKWDAKKELEAERAALIGELEKSATNDETAERKRLGETRAAVFAELEAALSPEIACQVEKAIDQRLSHVSPEGLAASKVA
jgi:hypothetical protein